MRKKKKSGLTQDEILTREIVMGLKNLKPSYRNWKNIMIKVNMLEMKHGLEVIKNTFDHALDIKQYCINLIILWLNECEDQLKDNENQHKKIIESFENIQQSLLEANNIDYEFLLSSLIHEYDTSFKKLHILHNDNETLIRTVIFKEQNETNEIIHNLTSQISYKLRNLKHKDQEVSKIEMVGLEEKVSSAWNLLTTILFKYLKDNQYRHLRYESLNQKNSKTQEIIAEHLKQMSGLINSIATFKKKIIEFNIESDEQVSKFVAIKCLVLNKYELMAKQYDRDRSLDDAQLKLLVKQYNITVKNLQNLTKKSQHILFLIRSCRKYQMHSEKLLPVQDDQLNQQFNIFDFFWYKVNTAILILDDLKKDKQCLLKNWHQLCESLRSRLVN